MILLLMTLLTGGLLAFVGTLTWAFYVKPKMRRRYERNRHRAKFRPISPAIPQDEHRG